MIIKHCYMKALLATDLPERPHLLNRVPQRVITKLLLIPKNLGLQGEKDTMGTEVQIVVLKSCSKKGKQSPLVRTD